MPLTVTSEPGRPQYLIVMWQRVYQRKFRNAKELNQHMLDMRHDLKQSVIDDAFGHQLSVIDDV